MQVIQDDRAFPCSLAREADFDRFCIRKDELAFLIRGEAISHRCVHALPRRLRNSLSPCLDCVVLIVDSDYGGASPQGLDPEARRRRIGRISEDVLVVSVIARERSDIIRKRDSHEERDHQHGTF
jgi:hypothetical protein